MHVAVDIGGTFTDVAVYTPEDTQLYFRKVLSQPQDLVGGILDAIRGCDVRPDQIEQFVHGSTVAINALLERKGAKTVLVTTKGFRDVYEIGRVNRPQSFHLGFRKHQPLVGRSHVIEADERVLADGSVLQSLTDDVARRAAVEVADLDAEAVGVVFLHSYRNPEHENKMAAALRDACAPGTFITTSSELSREYREFERTSTTVANAYVGPVVSQYLNDLETRLAEAGFKGELRLMQSNGGLCDVRTAAQQCIQMVESGPAGGVRGTIEVAQDLGLDRAIYFDMGGTTAKTCVVSDGSAALSSSYFVGGYAEGLPIRVPVLDITEIGTGGGSIGWLDEAGGLHVGPRSAGAEPGPACYGRGGTQPTVTDAHVVLGHLPPQRFLDGRMTLDVSAAEEAMRSISEPLGLSVLEAAIGILSIANAAMANAVRAVTTARGLDPRDFVLVACGGAGPMHAVDVARELGMSRVLIPHAPGTFSALGMLAADVRRDYVQTRPIRLDDANAAELEGLFGTMEQAGRLDVGTERGDVGIETYRSADVRYVGQEHTVTVGVAAKLVGSEELEQLKNDFDAAHELQYSHKASNEPAELVSLRVSVSRKTPSLTLPRQAEATDGVDSARVDTRGAALDGTPRLASAEVYDRALLRSGHVVRGPALIQEAGSCLCLPTGAELTCDTATNMIVEVS
jgi:N-methylhydantoinase A